jgi:hypothetical protein
MVPNPKKQKGGLDHFQPKGNEGTKGRRRAMAGWIQVIIIRYFPVPNA